MATTWSTGLIAQNANTTVRYDLSGVGRATLITAATNSGSAVGVRRHNALTNGTHHVNVETIGDQAAIIRLTGWNLD